MFSDLFQDLECHCEKPFASKLRKSTGGHIKEVCGRQRLCKQFSCQRPPSQDMTRWKMRLAQLAATQRQGAADGFVELEIRPSEPFFTEARVSAL